MARSRSTRLLRRVGHWPVPVQFGAAVGAGLLGYALAPSEPPAAGRAVMAWDTFALASLALLWCVLATANAIAPARWPGASRRG